MWDWQVSLLSGWRVRPQQYFDIGGELHLSVRALIICLRLTEKKHKCVKLSHFAQFLSFHSCTDGRVQPSCYTCDTNEYCANGQCSIDSNTRLPKCMWGVHSFIFVVYQSWLNPLHCFIVCMNISVCIYLCHYNTAYITYFLLCHLVLVSVFVCRCSPGWEGHRCESVASSDASGSGGRESALPLWRW